MNTRLTMCLAAALLGSATAQVPREAETSATDLFTSQLAASGPAEDMASTPIPGGVRVTVRRAGETAYTVQVMTDTSRTAIHAGDVVFVTFESRCSTPGGGIWQMYAQHNVAPWTGYFNLSGNPGADWHRYNTHWTADRDIPAGTMMITFHVASQPQQLELRGFRAVDLGRYKGALPYMPVTYAGREQNAPWRREAEARIDRYRKADLSVRVLDGHGKPVVGARVHVQQQRHLYEFGSFVEAPLLWQNEEGNRYRQWFLRAYNKATTPMYWADWGWENPEEHARYMQYPQWLKQHDIRIKAHVLIYPGWDFMPSRVRLYEHDPKALWRAMENHIREKLAADKPFGIISWDVTNETRDLKDLPRAFGSEEIYVRLYKLAHELAPEATLFLNENTILTMGGRTEPQQAEFERMIRYLLSQGAPLQGIGMQGHFSDVLTPPTEIWHIVDRFAKFGLPIQITEFDLPIQDPQAQADYTRDLLTAWFAHPATTGFTMWGFWEGSMWQPAGALVAKDGTVRANGQAWLDLVKKRWWTDVTVQTDARGIAKTRVFKGDYTLETEGTSKKISIGKDAQVDLSAEH